jgi:hypothetical protein
VSGQFLNTSFAGPRYIRAPQQPAAGTTAAAAAAAAAAASPSTWWQLDLGPQHRLLCNYYTIRHDGSQDGFVRSWVLQVSRNLLGLHSASGPLAAEHAYLHSALLLGCPDKLAITLVPLQDHSSSGCKKAPVAAHATDLCRRVVVASLVAKARLRLLLCCCFENAQGSNDLQHWLDLRRHLSDSTIRLPGQYGSWPISGPAASMPFRAFRLLLLGPTQSHSSPWAFCLSHWELYGYFYKLGSLSSAADSRPEGAAAAATAE